MRGVLYHRLGSGRYGMDKENFISQCKVLGEISVDLCVSVDDGHISCMEMADIFEEHGMKACFFPITGFLNNKNYLSLSHIHELHKRGHTIGSHGHQHVFFTKLHLEDLHREVKKSKDILEQCIGSSVDEISCPGGRFNEKVLNLLKMCEFKRVWTSEPGCWERKRPIVTHGRTCILTSWSCDQLRKTLEGKYDFLLHCRYRALGSIKWLLGDNLYHKITAHE